MRCPSWQGRTIAAAARLIEFLLTVSPSPTRGIKLNKVQPDVPVAPEIADDIHPDRPDFVHLSDMFKYISHYRRAGHQIGRKVGDMLEVITLAALYLSNEAIKRLTIEPKLIGFSGAGHKVEFAIFHLDDDGKRLTEMSELAGFVECKKVGVEQTIDTSFKTKYGGGYQKIPFTNAISIRLAPRWAEACDFRISFSLLDGIAKIKILKDGDAYHEEIIEAGARVIFGLTIKGTPFVLGNEASLRDISDSVRDCRVLEMSMIDEIGVTCLLNKCLAGPQTPEKAKQSAFVALDVRKGRFGQFDKRPNEKDCVSILVLTEYSHWEAKSINMIKACVDYNLVVDDSVIIKAMGAYENKFGLTFLDKITKENFIKDNEVRAVAMEIVAESDGRIFRDIEDGIYKRIIVGSDGLVNVQ